MPHQLYEYQTWLFLKITSNLSISRKYGSVMNDHKCLSIYVFVDSKQKAEFKAKIKPCSHLLNCMKLSELNEAGNALRIPKIYRNLSLRFSFFEIF